MAPHQLVSAPRCIFSGPHVIYEMTPSGSWSQHNCHLSQFLVGCHCVHSVITYHCSPYLDHGWCVWSDWTLLIWHTKHSWSQLISQCGGTQQVTLGTEVWFVMASQWINKLSICVWIKHAPVRVPEYLNYFLDYSQTLTQDTEHSRHHWYYWCVIIFWYSKFV